MAVVLATLSVAMVALLYFSLNPPGSRNVRTSGTSIECTSYHKSFLIIADLGGYNDSVSHGVPQNYWPILCAHQGDSVTILVSNTGREPHGFAVGHYYEGGASIAEGTSFTISFIVDKAGAFSIYCTILCSVHPWMLSGVLVVR